MDSTQEGQGNQSQEKQQGGGLGQGIDSVNNFMRKGQKSPSGAVGSRIIKGAGNLISKGSSFFTVGPGTIAIAIGIIVALTFIIVFSGFSGGAPGAPASEPTQTSAPTEAPTPPLAP